MGHVIIIVITFSIHIPSDISQHVGSCSGVVRIYDHDNLKMVMMEYTIVYIFVTSPTNDRNSLHVI